MSQCEHQHHVHTTVHNEGGKGGGVLFMSSMNEALPRPHFSDRVFFTKKAGS